MSSDRLYVLALAALVFSAPFFLVAHLYWHTRWKTFRTAMLSVGLLLAVLAVGLFVAGLARRPPCLQSHVENGLQPTLVGDIFIMMPTEYEVCDRRAPETKK